MTSRLPGPPRPRAHAVAPRGRRSPGTWGAALGVAGLALLEPRAARAGDGPDTLVRTPMDPWLVRLHRGPGTSDPARLVPWVDEMAAAGRARAGTETGARLLSGAASELARRGGAPAKAKALLEEALRAYGPDDPRAGLLWLDLADVRNDLGDPPGVLEALGHADRVVALDDRPGRGDRPRPTGPSQAPGRARSAGAPEEVYPIPQWRARLREEVSSRGDGLRRHALSAVGRHAEAATLWERRASEAGPGHDAAWEWAAEAAWAAGDRERALRDIDFAIATAHADGALVSRVAWRIRAAFGQMTARGDAAYRPAQITDGMFTAWRAAVRDHGDRPGGFQLALDAATFAMTARRDDEMIDFFTIAFTSPGFASAASRSLSRRLELVAAAHMALAAGRGEQALAWLQLAEHHHGGPLPRTEGLRLAIDEALGPPRVPPPASPAVVAAARSPTAAPHRPSPQPLPSGPAVEAGRPDGLPAAGPTDAPDAVGTGAAAPLALGVIAAVAAGALLLGVLPRSGPRVPRGRGRSRTTPREAGT